MGFWGSISETAKNVFKIPELRRRVLFTIGLLMIYRIGFHIPVPGIDPAEISKFMQNLGALGDILGTFAMLSGGSILQVTMFALGVMPYISAEIIFQLLVKVIPSLEELSKEGEQGRRKIKQYSRYTTVVICVIQAFFVVSLIQNRIPDAVTSSGMTFTLTAIITLTAGTFMLMWLGEMITEHGIGNGMSLIIMGGILANMPKALVLMVQQAQSNYKESLNIIVVLILFAFVVITIVTITLGQRRIPIQHAKFQRGRRLYGGQRDFMPLKVDQPGVIPIIFASALLTIPQMIFTALENWVTPSAGETAGFWYNFINIINNEFQRGGFGYIMLYVLMVLFFSFFWTKLMFNPVEMAKNMKEHGSFIPGIRPGKKTIEYLDKVVNRVTLAGGVFLAAIAILPMITSQLMGVNWSITRFIGGTGLLIVVGVALDLVQKVESHLVMRHYDGFFGHGGPSMKGRKG